MHMKKLGRVWLLCLTLAILNPLTADDRPNIVFAIADDWGWPHASKYGNDDVCQTPNFNRIARNGLQFNHAYISSPSCTPFA